MAQQRAIRLSLQKPTHAVCVVGTEVALDVYGSVPPRAVTFKVTGSSSVQIYMEYDPKNVSEPPADERWPLDADVDVILSVEAASTNVDDVKVRVSYYGKNGSQALGQALLHLTAIEVSLDVDTGRTGTVKRNKDDKKTWSWGPEGRGAILLVNCDRDSPLPGGVDYSHSRLYSLAGGNRISDYKRVLGPDKLSYSVARGPGEQEITFYVEGLAFPDADFFGLVSFDITLMDTDGLLETPIFTDTVVFRVAPWIMTPNTQMPLDVYVCSLVERESFQAEFLDAMTYLTLRAKCQLIICPLVDNRNDRWIQDEMEFGYIEAPHKAFPVVFDSPRNRGLKEFPFKRILGPDFGYVTREPAHGGVSSLDSFGNLDVSPPVTVKGKEYPLGRILIGSSFPKSGGRRMAKVVRNFLYAQKVQSPVELYSDWLSVGHVDEFLSFVPAPGPKGFRLLLASPDACFKLFQEKKDEGYGTAAQFEGLKRGKKKITIDEMLNDRSLRSDNRYAQKCIDWNREVLKRELGLSESDIIDIPQLFKLSDSYAEAFFPDMVNMIVLGKFLGIPKPFGPLINGRCCLEQKVQDLLHPLGLKCTFIDDYQSYHVLMGEIHCGTNVRRKPFSFKWWNMIP
ncbi:protein-arginine deiminase type-1-like isoform X2 [Antechinus flavipes]|uniref:protein-arginine deiminase type-1-like isoform X2 n=1 Tax=Antechinus flavipes TaxID=38775 RepID=UPI0022363FB7|nr:protein-arginine deiminase type-1-like isoform X2 [Antechinus flavipes]